MDRPKNPLNAIPHGPRHESRGARVADEYASNVCGVSRGPDELVFGSAVYGWGEVAGGAGFRGVGGGGLLLTEGDVDVFLYEPDAEGAGVVPGEAWV